MSVIISLEIGNSGQCREKNIGCMCRSPFTKWLLADSVVHEITYIFYLAYFVLQRRHSVQVFSVNSFLCFKQTSLKEIKKMLIITFVLIFYEMAGILIAIRQHNIM